MAFPSHVHHLTIRPLQMLCQHPSSFSFFFFFFFFFFYLPSLFPFPLHISPVCLYQAWALSLWEVLANNIFPGHLFFFSHLIHKLKISVCKIATLFFGVIMLDQSGLAVLNFLIRLCTLETPLSSSKLDISLTVLPNFNPSRIKSSSSEVYFR